MMDCKGDFFIEKQSWLSPNMFNFVPNTANKMWLEDRSATSMELSDDFAL
jgi:hypothetical protein